MDSFSSFSSVQVVIVYAQLVDARTSSECCSEPFLMNELINELIIN